MRTVYRNFRLVSGGKTFVGTLETKDGKISAVHAGKELFRSGDGGGCSECKEEKTVLFDGEGMDYLCPGFIDMHVHGGGGYSFTTGRAEDVVGACRYHLAHGATTLLPTLSSAPVRTIATALDAVLRAAESGRSGVNIVGAHIEGPYFSPAQCGAQNCAYITAPIERDYRALYERFGSFIRRWDYAPERDEEYKFTEFLADKGIVAACGHSDAIYEELYGAYVRGCRLVTHLYSGCSTVTRSGGFRRLGVVETAFLLDGMNVELIADGRHLPPELLKMVSSIKGEDRVSLVSDALLCAGGKDGERVTIEGEERIIEDGVVKMTDRSAFAGSVASADALVRTAVSSGISLPTAVKYVTENPARIFGLKKGILEKDFDADLVILDPAFNVKKVIIAGNTAF